MPKLIYGQPLLNRRAAARASSTSLNAYALRGLLPGFGGAGGGERSVGLFC